MKFLNSRFKVECENSNCSYSIGEKYKLIYKSNNDIIFYDENYNIKKISYNDVIWSNDKIIKNENFGILQKFKNYDPRFIYFNFKKISNNEYFQILKSQFPRFESYQIFTFLDDFTYIKKSYINSKELIGQQMKFNIKII
jgi:hypothetical protein